MGARVVALVAIATTACGRVGFDGVGGADVVSTLPFAGPAIVGELHASGSSEEDPSLTADMLEIVFERDQRLWTARRDRVDAPFATPTPIEELALATEWTPEISPDGLTLTFASTLTGMGDIYVATRADRASAWSPPERVAALSSAEPDEGAVTTTDLRAVVLASARPGGMGALDLFAAGGAGDPMVWDAPRGLAELNSPADDFSPFVHEPTAAIYFTSARSGNKDLYVAYDTGDGFSAAEPLAELNTPAREADSWVSPDGHTIYFTRTVEGSSIIFRASR
jgi:hypothetical protein